MSCAGYTVCLKSRNRFNGDSNAYSLALPALPRGQYRATFSVCATMTDPTELAVKWAGAQRHFEANRGDAYVTVCTFDNYSGSGVMYMSDPQNSVDVLFRSAATGVQTTAMPESDTSVHFEPLNTN